MNNHDVIIDFGGLDSGEKIRLIEAVTLGKKVKTKLMCFADGNFNSLYTEELSIAFNLNTLINIAQDLGFTMDHSKLSKEEMKEIIDELNSEGQDESYKAYMEEGNFLD